MHDMESMYYYTSSDTMSKILQGGSIWATNLDYMNDSREYRNGFQEIKGLLKNEQLVKKWISENKKGKLGAYDAAEIDNILSEKIKDSYLEASSRFTISFCKQKDLLSQWTTYAKESGVCLEMQFNLSDDSRFLLYKKDSKNQDGSEKKRELEVLTRPEEIFYFTKGRHPESGKNTYEEIAFKILDYLFRTYQEKDALKEFLPAQWERTSVFVKQYDFFQEEEYRLAFDTSKAPQIGYRSDNHVLKPYLDVACEYGWPVASIMVGPGFNQELVYNSIKFFLDHENIQSGLLHTAVQWKKHIQNYLRQSKQINEIWNKWINGEAPSEKEQANCYDFFNSLKVMTEEDLTAPGTMDSIHKRIKRIVTAYSNDYFKQHYFTQSGIILEKSQIPYIF